jgi:predicted transcriptional regulator YheO
MKAPKARTQRHNRGTPGTHAAGRRSGRKEIEKYLPLVDFLADMLGRDTEVVLHDLGSLSTSIIAIRNGHISGRKVGDPATDLVLKVLKEQDYLESDYLSNYRGVSRGGKMLKSSTYFIRSGASRKPIGMMCINMDCQKYYELKVSLDEFLPVSRDHGGGSESNDADEHFTTSVEDLTESTINQVVRDTGIHPKRMSQDERIEIVKALYKKGVFILKGAVSTAAKRLQVSEATVYRYLSKVKGEDRMSPGPSPQGGK